MNISHVPSSLTIMDLSSLKTTAGSVHFSHTVHLSLLCPLSKVPVLLPNPLSLPQPFP